MQWENNSIDNLFRTITYLGSVIVRELQQSLCHHRSSWMLLYIHTHLMWYSWHSTAIWIAQKNIYFRTHFRAESILQEIPQFKTQNWGFLKKKNMKEFVLRIINILFLLLWLNFSFSPLHCQESYFSILRCTKPLTLGETPPWIALCWQRSPELNNTRVDMTVLPTYHEFELPKSEREQDWPRFKISAHSLECSSFIY